MNYKLFTTELKQQNSKTVESCGAFATEVKQENQVINIYPQITYQEIIGFGGAFTEAAGYALSKMSPEVQSELVELYFGENGMGYNFCRGHIDSCDFSLGNYSAVTDKNDVNFNTFNLERDEQYVLPFIRAAMAASNESINLLLSPWSPPAFMKSTGIRNEGGFLLPEYREMWANYVCKYIKEYLALGINVTTLTVQNEPLAAQSWDSCEYTSEEEAVFVRDFLRPAMIKNNLGDIDLLVWDHNKERAFERADDIFTKYGAEDCAQGVAVHWYSGDHFETLQLVREKYPDKKIIFTEGCVEYSKNPKEGMLVNHAINYAHDMIGNFNAGLNAFIEWNMFLDQQGGPNHVSNFCEAPVMCNIDDNTYVVNPSLNAIGHFSKYVKRGAVRIAHSKYTGELELSTFKNPDGSLVMVLLNSTDSAHTYFVRLCGEITKITVKAKTIQT